MKTVQISTTTVEGWALSRLRQLREREFYGKMIIEMKEGTVVLLRLEETIKPFFEST